MTEAEREQQMRVAVEEYPDLMLREVAERVIRMSYEMAESYGWPREIADDPRFWVMVRKYILPHVE